MAAFSAKVPASCYTDQKSNFAEVGAIEWPGSYISLDSAEFASHIMSLKLQLV